MNDLLSYFSRIKFVCSKRQFEVYESYLKEILSYNQFINILGTNNKELIIKKHLLDILIARDFFQGYKTIVDIGTGAGFPGIPLAIVYTNSIFTLIESKQKKINFLEQVKKKLELSNINILHRNVNEIKEKYEVITCRAFATIKKIRKLTEKMSYPQTKYILFKGKRETIEKEIAEAKPRIYQCFELSNPFLLNDQRNIVFCQF